MNLTALANRLRNTLRIPANTDMSKLFALYLLDRHGNIIFDGPKIAAGDETALTAFRTLIGAAAAAAGVTIKVTVADEDERFALTTDDVQNGDYVLQTDTGVLYSVIDDTSLDDEDGYNEEDQIPMANIAGLVDALAAKAATSSLGAVATSNDYDDLDNKPDHGPFDVTNAQRLAGTRSDDTTPLVKDDMVRVTDQGDRIEQYLGGEEVNFLTLSGLVGNSSTNGVLIQLETLSNGKPQYTSLDEFGNPRTVFWTGTAWHITNLGSDPTLLFTSTEDVATPDLVGVWTDVSSDGGTVLIELGSESAFANDNWLVLENTVELSVRIPSGGLTTSVNGVSTPENTTTLIGWVKPMTLMPKTGTGDYIQEHGAFEIDGIEFGIDSYASFGAALSNGDYHLLLGVLPPRSQVVYSILESAV